MQSQIVNPLVTNTNEDDSDIEMNMQEITFTFS